MAKTLTVQDFFKMFPDDAACLAHLMDSRFGGTTLTCAKCNREGSWLRLKKLPAYSCPHCGHHIHPMVGTPFERSSTPLQKWFYAMYLFTTSRHGVPAKELQRQLGVTYKTAWRMGHEIRKYMGTVDGNPPLSGDVEIDETYIGGVTKGQGAGLASGNKTAVFGMVERGGKVMTKAMPRALTKVIHPLIVANIVKEGTTIHSDEWRGYWKLSKLGYTHKMVMHANGQYVNGSCHTNTIEGLWSQLKRSIRGTHVHVSGKHLDKYLGEFEFRYNMRKNASQMFPSLLAAF